MDTFVLAATRLGAVCLISGTAWLPARGGSAETAIALDPGGFSVDFWNAGRTPATGPDLLRNGDMEAADSAGRPAAWEPGSYVWLPVPDSARQAQLHERAAPLMRWEASAEAAAGGAQAVRLAIPVSAFDPARDPAGHEVCALFHQRCVLPAAAENAKYVLAFLHRGHSEPAIPNSRAYARITFYDSDDQAQARETRVCAQTIFQAAAQWRRGELQFIVPAGTRCLDVRLALTGGGEVWYDDVSLRRCLAQETGPTVRLMPWYYLDNLYCLSSGDAGVMNFGFRNEGGTALDRPHLLLQLPEGIELLDLCPATAVVAQTPRQVEGAGVCEYRLDLSAWKGRIHDGTFRYPYNMWDGLALLLRSSLPPGETRHSAWYWLEDGSYRSAPLTFAIQIVPALPTTAGPQRFRSGAHLFLLQYLRHQTAIQAFAKLYQQVGFNAVHTPPSPLSAELGRLGIERYTQPSANGYAIGDATPGAKPDDAVFRLVDGAPLWDGICPVEVYRRGAYFRDQIQNGMLRKLLVTERQAEQVMANWEPFMYSGKGCFCLRCRAEFATYSRLPAAAVDRVWPKDVIHEHGELWQKFRSWQHGKLMATLEETVNALGREAGLESHFIPEIHYGLLTEGWAKEAGNREYAAVDYLDRLPVLEPWAPYTWYIFTDGPYDYVRGLHLSVHATARQVQEFLARRQPEGRRARLIAFPYGTYEGATQPEALAFEFLTYFLNGYSGAFAYLFPGGYDARYWRALGEANRQLALFEPFVGQGRAVTRHTLTCETPLPAPDARFLAPGCATIEPERGQDLALLQSWEFAKGDARLIAIGNFWERGECFFRLTPKSLKRGTRYVLREPAAARVYADAQGNTARKARDLEKGVLLHAGAMRHAFFLLEPFREGVDGGAIVRPEAMARALQARLDTIRTAFRSEATIGAVPAADTPGYAGLKSLRSGGLVCTPVSVTGLKTPCLRFQSARQTLTVDPATGGRILSWTIGDSEAVHREDPFGLILDAFWQPALQIFKPYEVLAQEETAQGVKVVLRRVLAQEGGALRGVTLRKTIEVPAAAVGFKVRTEITNTSETDRIEFSYRWHNMMTFLEQQTGRAGWACMQKAGQPVRFTRQFVAKAFRRATVPDTALDVLPTAAADAIDADAVVFGCDWTPVRVRVDLQPQLYAIGYWDEGGMPCATFEPIFPRTVLKWGQTWAAECEWREETGGDR